MKVWIGKYKNWFGPYQLAELLMFWVPKEKDEHGFPRTADRVHYFGEWLAHGSVEPEPKPGDVTSLDRDRPITWLYKFLSWVDKKRKRTIIVKIDRWDTWNMDTTLAYIVVPMLEQLKQNTHGAPNVDDDDVPEELKSTSAPPKKEEYDIDDNHFKRWDWALDEMIFAFKSKLEDWEEQFYSGSHSIKLKKLENGDSQMVKDENDTFKVDEEGMKAYQDRINHGFRLFGKYYNSLWD